MRGSSGSGVDVQEQAGQGREGVKRKSEEVMEEDSGKKQKSKAGEQGTKRKSDDEEEDIRRLIEEKVGRKNPGWVRGEPSEVSHIDKVEVARVVKLVDKWV